MENRIKMGISTCLLGENVRYDGGHKLDRYIRDTLGEYVNFVPVCPEVECGMPVPREAMRLVGDPESPRLVTILTRKDMTKQMLDWAAVRVRELESEELCGYIFKSNSPSSGMERVKVYDDNGMPQKKGVGLFAKAFMDRFPLLPTEEEGRLHDPRLRENFIESVFVLKRWREVKKGNLTRGNLVAFHTRHKLQLMSHSITAYRAMGKLVAGNKEMPVNDLYRQYEILLLQALRLKCTVKKHTNVLQHMMGYFKKQLSADEKEELLDVIFDYHSGMTPLIVPVTLFNHYVRKYDESYLKKQTYLNPHPAALKLRNHA